MSRMRRHEHVADAELFRPHGRDRHVARVDADRPSRAYFRRRHRHAQLLRADDQRRDAVVVRSPRARSTTPASQASHQDTQSLRSKISADITVRGDSAVREQHDVASRVARPRPTLCVT